jgi:predicted small integral membrane protein
MSSTPSSKWVIHSKVKAAFFATLAVVLADVALQVTDHFPGTPIVGILALFIPVVVGWAKKEEAAYGGSDE